jgi:S-adenosyl-L-methionine hydrolase (adenosine-forming)
MITLLTDFGLSDYFVPAVKGVILSINPQARIVDLTHEIAAQDIDSAAFILGACYHNFPSGTIHMAIVDPGVGSFRRAIVVRSARYLFIGPDNGIFSYVYRRESKIRVFQIKCDQYLLHPVSATFHGRDVFASVTAWLSRGVDPETIGEEITDYVRLEIPQPKREREERTIEGRVIHIDRFGNCITNLTIEELSPDRLERSATTMLFEGREIKQFGTHFAQADQKDQLFAYLGSAGYWEIAVWCGSAAETTGAQRGSEVTLKLR